MTPGKDSFGTHPTLATTVTPPDTVSAPAFSTCVRSNATSLQHCHRSPDTTFRRLMVRCRCSFKNQTAIVVCHLRSCKVRLLSTECSLVLHRPQLSTYIRIVIRLPISLSGRLAPPPPPESDAACQKALQKFLSLFINLLMKYCLAVVSPSS